MHLIKVDPRALKDNPDTTRHTKSTPQADALLLATIKAVGVIQPPVIARSRAAETAISSSPAVAV